MKDKALQQKLAENLHYLWKDEMEAKGQHLPASHEDKGECKDCNSFLVHWTELPEESRADLLRMVDRFEEALHQNEHAIVTAKDALGRTELVYERLDELEASISDFVKKLTHPRGVADLFPVKELAMRLCLRFKFPKKESVNVEN